MKLLFNWLKEFVPLEFSPDKVAETLLALGFEVAALHKYGEGIQGVVVADVQDVSKHPNADKLSVCRVNDGIMTYSVVCGAPNVQPGLRVALARVGASLPGGTRIGAAKIRGVDSQGMICSGQELGLEEKSDGIMPLDPSLPIGQDIRKALGLDDVLIEIEVTPNRRDALSILGIARELSAAYDLPLRSPEPRARELDPPEQVTVVNEVPELCPYYTARIVREVTVGPSPTWMTRRLDRCGFRSINNVVDATNYVLLELGQPLHVFDRTQLTRNEIRIRTAAPGERLKTLDGRDVLLQEGMLVIADGERPVALAGVIGGEDSAVTSGTREVVLESAMFDPTLIRRARRALGIVTESSYRFERGTDAEMVKTASLRAAQLLQELAGGTGCKPVQSLPKPFSALQIKLRPDQVRKRLGLDLKDSFMAESLRRLGCTIGTGTAHLLVTMPSWRADLKQEADLIEEVARLAGYETVPVKVPRVQGNPLPENPIHEVEAKVRSLWVGMGFSEAMNDSFLSEEHARAASPPLAAPPSGRSVTLANPLSNDFSTLRPSLLPGLLQNVQRNAFRQIESVRLFEIGRVFWSIPTAVMESRHAAFVLYGPPHPHWRWKGTMPDFYEGKGVLESLLQAVGVSNPVFRPLSHAAFHPSRSATVEADGQTLAQIGEIHPEWAERLDLPGGPVVMGEIALESLLKVTRRGTPYRPLAAFPAVRRDISFVIDEATPYQMVEEALRQAGGKPLELVNLIDLYKSSSIKEGKRSLTLRLTFRDPTQTLTDAEVEKAIKEIREAVQKLGGTLR